MVLLPVLGRKPAVAKLAFERLLARVNSLVAHERRLVACVVTAQRAEVPLGVGENVDSSPGYFCYADYRVLMNGNDEKRERKQTKKTAN